MMKKKSFIILFLLILIFAALLFLDSQNSKKIKVVNNGKVLGGFADISSKEIPSPTEIIPTPTEIPSTPTPTPIDYKVSFIDSTAELLEGGNATFTWYIDGPPKTFHKSAVYFGTISSKGNLIKDIAPAETKYTDSVKDFLTGDFITPLRFVGNTAIAKSGNYYSRAYAFIDGNNYWSDEREFTVKPIPTPGYDIRIINYPKTVKLNDNSTFTWDISGPQATSGFTAIVGAKESKSGHFEETIDINKTPYKVLVKDFTNGVYSIPLRYIGNTVMPEYGTYYIRALVIINGRNIWSDEYTLTVQ